MCVRSFDGQSLVEVFNDVQKGNPLILCAFLLLAFPVALTGTTSIIIVYNTTTTTQYTPYNYNESVCVEKLDTLKVQHGRNETNWLASGQKCSLV